MGIRIDPTLEFVWRDPATVQLGVDPPRAVVPVPTTAEERFLCGLRQETGRDALGALAAAVRCPPAVAAAVLAAAAPTVVEPLAPPGSLVHVHGAGPVADAVAGQLSGEPGVTVTRTAGATTVPSASGTAAGASTARSASVTAAGASTALSAAGEPVEPSFAVVVADHVVDPALRAAWSRRDVPHLALVVGDGAVHVGPVVDLAGAGRGPGSIAGLAGAVPGAAPGPGPTAVPAGPCLQCLEYARVDADPAWPAIAAQVWGRPAASLGAWRTAAVASAAVGLVLSWLPSGTTVRDRRGTDEELVFDRADLRVSRRPVRPHPRCSCRGLPGTDSAHGPRHATTPAATR
ncbi:hypothetical protein Csp2054_00150 [Curtobacterium sp. 'Ferrero']|uniref:hypothetical protein n=1 Tax=Curtobacterium sp. 'Ferrero' TaxID=2033654 RepID=UPI000BC71346|nr:hypothetical protein [Curtobacterium sp. 'Ferrero']PCN49417.1 hypothetical protein Csp2054_00150 [Curtobacterium sp. 'Ferrero']